MSGTGLRTSKPGRSESAAAPAAASVRMAAMAPSTEVFTPSCFACGAVQRRRRRMGFSALTGSFATDACLKRSQILTRISRLCRLRLAPLVLCAPLRLGACKFPLHRSRLLLERKAVCRGLRCMESMQLLSKTLTCRSLGHGIETYYFQYLNFDRVKVKSSMQTENTHIMIIKISHLLSGLDHGRG